MKQILLLLTLFVFSVTGFSQDSYTFDDCTLPSGFTVGQGIGVGGYDNPNRNGCGNADDDCGLITPGVGGNNPAFIATPQIAQPTINTSVRVTFNIFVFDANLKCNTAKAFPCPTYVTAYVVDLSYSSNTPPTTFYGSSDRQLVNANGANLITIPITTSPGSNPTRIYLDFSTDLTCNQPNTKYVIDVLASQSNIPLPVSFKSFSASRKSNTVSLDWTTVSEANNKGFDVQRLNGSSWETIAFVPSQSKLGFGNTELNYNYSDANTASGITQYRLIQQDFDGKQTYSAVRAVQGLSQAGRIIVSPNPARNGQTNIIFENATERRNLQLTDMVGRTVGQWNNYADNSLQLNNLVPGMYQLRIVNAATGAQSVQKIMVSGQ